jgi:predicted dehydrogenase
MNINVTDRRLKEFAPPCTTESMKNERGIRLGIIGAGAITQARHLPGLKKIPGVTFVAICNRSINSSTRVAKLWNFERIARTPDEIIHAKDIDAILIGTWPYLHQPLSCAALKVGKHVFTQARMARNLNEATEMVKTARRYPKLVSMICPSPFGIKCTLYVQKLLEEDFVGKIRLVQFHSLNSGFANPETPIHWRQQSKFNGVNTLSFGIYIERFLQWFGPIEYIYAKAGLFTSKRKEQASRVIQVTVPDQLLAIAQLQNHPGQLHLSFSGAVYHAPSDEVEIYGDKGTLKVDFTNNEVWGAQKKNKELKKLSVPLRLQRDWKVEADFIDAIRAGGKKRLPRERTRFFSPDFEEGLKYMAVTETAIRSMRSHQVERIPRIL